MIASDPSLRSRFATAAALTWYTPGRTPAGRARPTVKLFASSSRWNDRLSAGTPAPPDGGVSTTCAVAGPRARFVTGTVNDRGPAAVPSTGQTTRSGGTATSNGRVTNTGRRTSPMLWSRYRETISRVSASGSPATVSRTVSCSSPGSNGSPRNSGGTPPQSYSAPTRGRRRKYGCERAAPGATVTAKRRAASVPGATGEVAASTRSTFHPAGAATSMPSSVTAPGPEFQTVASIWTRSPGITTPSSAAPSSATPAAAASV